MFFQINTLDFQKILLAIFRKIFRKELLNKKNIALFFSQNFL